MISSPRVGVHLLGVMLAGSALHGQTAAHYRDFELGGDMAAVATRTGVNVSEAKTVHTRPAMMQDLEWRRPYNGSDAAAIDSVQRIAFSFYNDQLFRLVVDYDRERTEGMTDADMIEAISMVYGMPVKPVGRASSGQVISSDEEFGARVAGWGDAEYSAVLYRSSYESQFKMVVTSFRLNALARTAAARAVRLDERDAPALERARQKKSADDARASKAKARLANKAAFKP